MLKIKGIKKVCSESKGYCTGYYGDQYLQLNYDIASGECWTDHHCDLGHKSCVVYRDKNIINCGNIVTPMTMLEIRVMIESAVDKLN